MRRILHECEYFKWIDLSHPSRDELEQLRQDFNLHPVLVQDCMDPVHLPKYEKVGNITFIIVRIYDSDSLPSSDSVQNLTRKIAIFIGPGFFITIHRLDPNIFGQMTEHCLFDMDKNLINGNRMQHVLVKFINKCVRTYLIPLEKAEDDLDLFESNIFTSETNSMQFQKLHIVRRRISLIKRILIHSQDVIRNLSPASETASPVYQDLKESISSLVFMSDEFLEDATNILSLQISMASQKTNEVVRVLTIFSVFFMPLTFIVGVYGMNFQFMPELHHEFGYLYVWILMIVVTVGIAYWFLKKGWIHLPK